MKDANRPRQLHDTLVRQFFEYRSFAKEFFGFWLPPEVQRVIDMDSIQLRPGRLNDPNFRWTDTDVLFETTLCGQQVTLYLMLEHQSSSDRWMPLRLLRNTVALWVNAVNQGTADEGLPVVIPMLLAQCQESWDADTNVGSLVGGLASLPKDVVNKLPQTSCFVFDVNTPSNEQIKKASASALLRLFVLVLRNVRDPKITSMFDEWEPLFARARAEADDQPNGLQALVLLLDYLGLAVKHMTQETWLHVGQMAGVEPVLLEGTLAWNMRREALERGIERGIEQGIERGRVEGARRVLLKLLCRRFGQLPDAVREKVGTASSDQLESWTDNVITASDLSEVFAV